jgi:hypothetical protein
MNLEISFSDLAHPGHQCNNIPYAAALVAAYALKHSNHISGVRLFKDPYKLAGYLERGLPDLACFSNYIWNFNLSYQFAKRIKAASPKTIIVFGGPNYPLTTAQQREFLSAHPDIDFYIYREGERAFLQLTSKLLEYNLDACALKRAQQPIPSCHYILDGRFIRNELSDRFVDLDEIPSPYLSGLCDEFLEQELIPLMQTTRGCPFRCTYCQEGGKYFSRITRFSTKRIAAELEYIASRTPTPNLQIADSNFGMYKEDIEICKAIAAVQDQYGWPTYFVDFAGKNNKERVLQAVSIVRGSHHLSAAVQSTDPQVLDAIGRRNVSLIQMLELARESEKSMANSFSEIILGLPCDSKAAHFKSIADLIDCGLNVVRSHQLLMLPGSEIASPATRRKYGLSTAFRVVPHTAAAYRLFGNEFTAPEVDELCVANDSMSFEDYLDCRLFNLTVEIFYNNGIFQELIRFLRRYDVSISSFIRTIHDTARLPASPLYYLYEGFLRESNEIWQCRKDLEDFLSRPGVIQRYRSGELGNNEQLMYRAIAVFKHMEDLHDIAFDAAFHHLACKGGLAKQQRHYLEELSKVGLACKKDLLSGGTVVEKHLHYDFVQLATCGYDADPFMYQKPEGIDIRFSHSEDQKKLINTYKRIYGVSNYGLGNILGSGSNLNSLYRSSTAA